MKLAAAAFALVLGWYGERVAAEVDAAFPGNLPGDSAAISCPTVGVEAGSPLLLAKAVDLALCNNPRVRAAWESIRIQAAEVGRAKAAYWPSVAANVSELGDRTGYPGTSIPTTTRSDATVYGSLTWRLFDFGGRAATRRAAEALLAAAVASRDATLQKTLTAVVQAYFDAVTLKALIDSRSDDESLAHDTLASAQRRLAQGGAAQSDALQAQTALARISLDKNRVQGSYERAVATLAYVLGLPPQSALALPADVDLQSGDEEQDLSAWLKEAERSHPAIVAARTAVDAAREQVTVARASSRPTLDFTSDYYQNAYPGQGLTSTNTKVTTFGLSVTVPLFDGFATHYKVRGAEATVREKEAELEDTEQETLMEIVRAHADAQSSLRNLRASQELLEAAQQSLESSRRRYGSGATSILELLTTQAALADARSERVRCLAEWRTARLVLLASAGVLNRASLSQ